MAQCSLQFGPAFHPRDFNRERLEPPAAQFDELAEEMRLDISSLSAEIGAIT